jgi:acyl dehydratase
MLHKPVDELTVGEAVPSRGRTVTETDVVSFCYLTGNWLEIHSNEEVAAKTPYGRRLVQGSLVFSIVPGLVEWDARYTIAMYAVNDMRFPRPVFIGDTITAQIAVDDVQMRDADTGIATFAVKVVNQRGEVVQTFQMRILGRRARAVAALLANGASGGNGQTSTAVGTGLSDGSPSRATGDPAIASGNLKGREP